MAQSTYVRILYSYFTWFQIFGTLLSVFMLKQEQYAMAFSLLVVCLLAMAVTCVKYVRKMHKLRYRNRILIEQKESLMKCCEILHDLNHTVRDTITDDKFPSKMRNSEWLALIRMGLTHLEECFRRITKLKCCASIMLPDDSRNPKEIETAIRSLNEPATREKFKTTLKIGQGLAGKAFETGVSQWSNNFGETDEFFPVRQDYKVYYNSGISSPFKANGRIHGVLNLDCEEPIEFENGIYFLVQCVADLIGFLYQLRRVQRQQRKL